MIYQVKYDAIMLKSYSIQWSYMIVTGFSNNFACIGLFQRFKKKLRLFQYNHVVDMIQELSSSL